MRTLLVVGADADPAGSGAGLLPLLGKVRDHHPDVAVHILLQRGGPLIHRFHAVGPTTCVDWYDRRVDHRRAAAILRRPRCQQRLARAIDRATSAALPRRLPRVPADVVLVDGWAALPAGALGADRAVPRVVLLTPRGLSTAGAAGATSTNGRRPRTGAVLSRAAAVLVGTAADRDRAVAAGGAAERISVHHGLTGATSDTGPDRRPDRPAIDAEADLVWGALEHAAIR